MVYVEGTFAAGNRLKVHLAPSVGKPRVFTPVVTRMTYGESFRWRGRFVFPYLFDGERVFELESLSLVATRLMQRENFRGLLVPFLRGMLNKRTKADFQRMNQALKTRAENRMVS